MIEHNDEFAAIRKALPHAIAGPYRAKRDEVWRGRYRVIPRTTAGESLPLGVDHKQACNNAEWFAACDPTTIARLLAAADRAKELEADARRLDYLIRHEAWIGWNREGDSCRVWVRDDDEDDHIPEPVCRWHVTFDNPRAAIDAAIDIAQGTAT